MTVQARSFGECILYRTEMLVQPNNIYHAGNCVNLFLSLRDKNNNQILITDNWGGGGCMLIYFQSAQSLRRLNLMKFFKCLLCPRLAARMTALSQPRSKNILVPT